jgi:hypothetical protein
VRKIPIWVGVVLLVGIELVVIRAGAQKTPTPYAPPSSSPIVSAGTIQINNATSGTYVFPSAIPSGAVCASGPLSDIAQLPSLGWVTSDTTLAVTITLSAAGTGTFWFICYTSMN